jgi:hypothetical protein
VAEKEEDDDGEGSEEEAEGAPACGNDAEKLLGFTTAAFASFLGGSGGLPAAGDGRRAVALLVVAAAAAADDVDDDVDAADEGFPFAAAAPPPDFGGLSCAQGLRQEIAAHTGQNRQTHPKHRVRHPQCCPRTQVCNHNRPKQRFTFFGLFENRLRLLLPLLPKHTPPSLTTDVRVLRGFRV